MEKGICIFLISIFLSNVYGQRCPANWYGYSATSKCYRFMYLNRVSWQDARDICQIHGGDLLKIDTVAEKNWVYNQLASLKTHSQIPTTDWWVGLNNREYLTTWEWADGSAVARNVINWKPGEPNNAGGNERCGEIYNKQFNDEDCINQNRFICSRDRGIPLTCDSDHGWQSVNGQCFKIYTGKANWRNAKNRCRHDGGALVTIDSQSDEIVMHDFAIANKQQLWIGLYSVQQPGNTAIWMWTNNTQLSNSYWHGTPHIARNHLNSSCAVVSNSVPDINAWSVQPCSQTRAYVCRKPQGVCFPGWIGHLGYCYQFDVQYRQSFSGATNYCKNQGAELLRYTGGSTTQFINSYLQEMKDSGANDFWIGASDNNQDHGAYKWRNGQNVTYKYWAARGNNPANTAHKQDCAYVVSSDKSGKWRTTSNCGAQKSYVCFIRMGGRVRTIPRTPRPHYGCPTNWKQYGGQCYRIFDQGVDWLTARTNCQQTSGADLATIRSQGTQNFINHLAKRGVNYWIGLNDRAADGTYVWNDEGVPTTFTAWKPHEPNNGGHQENCVAQLNNQWLDVLCSQRKHYICSKDANSVLPPTPPPTQAMDWTVKCGPGWESNPITSSCYQFIDEPLAWVDALNQCQKLHSSLVSIETLSEQNYIAGRIQSMNSIGVWTGANDRGTEGGWRWVSGKPFAFLNWGAGQPGSHGQGTDCVVMLALNAKWDDIDCSQRNGYICEKVGHIPRTPAPRTTTARVPPGMVLGCAPNWKPYGKNCYFFAKQRINWMDANIKCGTMRAELTSIQSRNEQNFIVANLWKNPKVSYDGVYIGLSDRQIESSFTWSDGSAVQYTNWGTNEPNHWMNKNEDCVEVRLNNGKWNDETCTTLKGGFVCKKPKSIVSATQNPYQTGCPPYSLGYESHCFKFISGNAKSWVDANNFCNRTYHGTLATVNDRYIQAFLSSQLLYKTGYYWLGMTDIDNPGTYSWVSGDSIKFTYWYNTHTGNERSTCIGMRADQPIGLWENQDCTHKNNFICQSPRHGGYSTTPTTPTPYPNVPCPSGWTANKGQCFYAYSGKTQILTWMNALSFCQSLGGDLASFHTATNDSFLTTLLDPKGPPAYWIGLNDRDTEAGHTWSDGSPVDYTNWNQGEPNDYKGNEDCVRYVVGTQKWNDNNCYSAANYICAIPRGATLPATTVIPTPMPSTQCGYNGNWYLFNGNCYMLNPTSGPNATMTWYDSSDYCNGNNAQLVSIHSLDENNFIQGLINSRSLTNYWIGFNELSFNGYSWTDTTPVDYTNWNANEPNDFFGGERCVEFYSHMGRWNDNNCGVKRGYVCKKPVSGKVVIPPPVPYPSGGCANGFIRVPGGRNKCFYLNHNKLNWTMARDTCRRFGVGYDIASVEALYEQDFFMAMATYRQKTNVWIGLNDLRTNNQWLWQDNSKVIYTHWDKGEPTSSHSHAKTKDTENCVAIRMWKGHEGKWADVACDQAFASLCQAKQDPNIQIIAAPSNCQKGYKSFQQGCYKISTDVKTWADASSACQADGGQLASILSIYESGFVFTLAGRHRPFWIGLSDSVTHGLYGWSDGWPVKYTEWGYKEPSYDNPGGCVLVNGNGRWNDTDCSRKLSYVCKISSAKPPASTPPPPGNCADPKWISNGDYCYTASVNQGRSWPEANYQCQKMGMQLVSIHSKAEMDFVFNLLSQAKINNPQYKPNIWVGLAKGPMGSFSWTDNTAVNYLNWNPGQPTGIGTHGQLEECVEINRVTGKWNDLSCFTNRGYVCKALKVFQTGQNPIYTVYTWPPIIPGVTVKNGNSGSNSALQQQQQQNTGSSLSGGAIAGVVIGGVIVIALVALIFFVLKSKGIVKAPQLQRSASGGLGFDNALYNRGNNAVKIDSDA